jgi:hypothetical protein
MMIKRLCKLVGITIDLYTTSRLQPLDPVGAFRHVHITFYIRDNSRTVHIQD